MASLSEARRTYAYAALLIVIMAFALRAHALLISLLDGDEGVYLVTAQRWLAGGLPYVEVWDQHPPGLPALLALAQQIIPDPVLGGRLAATLAVTVTALLLHRFGSVYLNRPRSGLTGALLYVFCISRWAGLAANTEVFNNACVTSAAYLLYSAVQRPRSSWVRAIAAAGLFGVGLQIKYVVFPEAVVLCLGYLTARYYQRCDIFKLTLIALSLVLAGCLPTAITVLYFWLHGALQPFLDANIGANLAYLSIVPTAGYIALAGFNGLAPLAGALLVIFYMLVRRVRWHWPPDAVLTPERWIFVWSIAALADVGLPLKFYNHYYFALYPPVCLAGAVALSVATRNQRSHFAAGLGILFASAVPIWAMGEARAARVAAADASREVAARILQSGTSTSSLFIYNYDPAIYALTRLRPPTPYVLGGELVEFSHSSHVNGAAEVQRIIDSSPDFIVVHQPQPSEFEQVELDRLVARGLLHYRLVCRVRNGADGTIVSLYKR